MMPPILPFLIIHNQKMAFEHQQKIIKQQKENEEKKGRK